MIKKVPKKNSKLFRESLKAFFRYTDIGPALSEKMNESVHIAIRKDTEKHVKH